MVQTAFCGFMLGGAWLVYLGCRWALAHVALSFAMTDSDQVALAFLGAFTFLLLLATAWARRR
jgi:hypothetical protein